MTNLLFIAAAFPKVTKISKDEWWRMRGMQILLTNKGTLSGSCHSYAKGAVILGGGEK